MVLDSLRLGGAERHVVDLSLALHRRGHDVMIVCSAGGPFEDHLAGEVPVRVLLREEVKRRVSPSFAWRLRQVVAEGFDLVHAHMFASAAAAATTGCPLVITEHSEARWQGRCDRIVNKWACRRAGAVIAVSRPIGRRVQGFGVGGEKLHVLASVVPPAQPGGDVDYQHAFGRKSHPVVGVVARLVPEKGIQYLIDCFPEVVRLVPDARLLIIGDGPLRDSLETRAREIGVVEKVVFAGSLDARPLLPAISVLAVPSVTEGTPLAMLEAMAAGIPVVATSVGGVPDQLHHGVDGLLVAPADTTVLGAALIRLLRNGDEARQMGDAGRQRVARYSHEAMACCVERIYDAVVAGSRERAVETAVQAAS